MAGRSAGLLDGGALDDSSLQGDQLRVRLTDGDDRYFAGDSGEYIRALKGDDRVVGGDGGDTIYGGSGNDDLFGQRGDDYLDGGKGNDDLLGGAGHDQLSGGDGDDGLDGDSGPDVMTGGAGLDRIAINPGDSDGKRDMVIYNAVSDSLPNMEDQLSFFRVGEDKIDLSRIDAVAGTPEDDAFHFIGGRAFGDVAGELRFDGEFVEGDVNGDGQADLRIDMRSFVGPIDDGILHGNDFIL